MLKKEARILGLSATARRKNRIMVVGAVFRGRSWLDGILTCSLDLTSPSHISRISRTIMTSKQYSQLHAVILSRQQSVLRGSIDVAKLARKIKLPVISIEKNRRATIKQAKESLRTNHYDFTVNQKRLSVLASGISLERAQEIFTVACTPDNVIPEAVRVANLLAEQGFCLRQITF